MAGREVARLYVSAPAGRLDKPASELKAFAKTGLLPPGQSPKLTFRLTPADLASFDPSADAWVADAGTCQLKVGASSLAIKQQIPFRPPAEIVVEKSRRRLAPQVPIAELKPTKK